MGILDEAIREHLELKRQHGAEEKEIEGLEAEAFGPADRPEAVEPETQILSPEEASGPDQPLPASAGPEPAAEISTEPGPQPAAEAAPVEPATAEVVPEPPAPEPVQELAPEPPVAPEPDDVPLEELEGDAGDLLEAERHRLAGHPTEHYDVDAAIAEEDELDILSESSLSDELDRALEDPVDSVSSEGAADPESDLEPLTADPPASGAVQEIEDAEFEAVMDTPPDEEPREPLPDPEELDEDEPSADFFDQDDPLEGTPDFLEETPEHDRLWFEQREPKDFDFGD